LGVGSQVHIEDYHGCGYLEDMREELREMYEYGIDEQFWVGSLEDKG